METGRLYFVKDEFTVPADLMAELNRKARKKIRYNQQGKKFGMSDITKIYNELVKNLVNKAADR